MDHGNEALYLSGCNLRKAGQSINVGSEHRQLSLIETKLCCKAEKVASGGQEETEREVSGRMAGMFVAVCFVLFLWQMALALTLVFGGKQIIKKIAQSLCCVHSGMWRLNLRVSIL